MGLRHKVLRTRERAPTPFPSVVFTFGFVVESIKEFEGASSHAFPKYLKIAEIAMMHVLGFVKDGRCFSYVSFLN
jgi:hypothetical protein